MHDTGNSNESKSFVTPPGLAASSETEMISWFCGRQQVGEPGSC